MLNEQLYTSEGEEAFNMMQGQPDLFEQYHEVRRSSDAHVIMTHSKKRFQQYYEVGLSSDAHLIMTHLINGDGNFM